MKRLLIVTFVLGLFWPAAAQAPALLARRYVEGDRLQYLMKGQNDGSIYEVRITGVVQKGTDSPFVEEYSFSDFISNGKPVMLSPSAQAFRVAITLEKGRRPFTPPDLSQAPRLIGPITDLLTFYADLFLAMTEGELRRTGDRFYFQNPAPASWADGNVVVIGEGSIDFDIVLTEARDGVAVLVIKHVVPPQPKIRVPADWMHAPVADTPNNWVQVRKTKTGYAASVGKETFDVELHFDLADGKILAAKMDNPVTKITRDCTDLALTQCGEPRPDPTLRRIEMSLVRN